MFSQFLTGPLHLTDILHLTGLLHLTSSLHLTGAVSNPDPAGTKPVANGQW